MKTLLLGILLSTAAWARPLAEQAQYVNWAAYRYPIHLPFVTSILRYESGRRGSEAGLNPVKTFTYDSLNQDPQAYADPTMPSGALQHNRLVRRIIYQSQQYVLEESDHRNEFFGYLAKLQGYDPKLLRKVYLEERSRCRKESDRGLFNPWVCMTVTTVGAPGYLDSQKCLMRWTVNRYHTDEPLLATLCRIEMDQRGSELGLNLKQISAGRDPQGMLDLMPEGALNQSRIAWRTANQVLDWIFNDEWRRRNFFRWWAKKYLAGGRVAVTEEEKDEANAVYAKEFSKVYGEERLKWKK